MAGTAGTAGTAVATMTGFPKGALYPMQRFTFRKTAGRWMPASVVLCRIERSLENGLYVPKPCYEVTFVKR